MYGGFYISSHNFVIKEKEKLFRFPQQSPLKSGQKLIAIGFRINDATTTATDNRGVKLIPTKILERLFITLKDIEGTHSNTVLDDVPVQILHNYIKTVENGVYPLPVSMGELAWNECMLRLEEIDWAASGLQGVYSFELIFYTVKE